MEAAWLAACGGGQKVENCKPHDAFYVHVMKFKGPEGSAGEEGARAKKDKQVRARMGQLVFTWCLLSAYLALTWYLVSAY